MPTRFAASALPSRPLGSDGSMSLSLVARLIFFAMSSAVSSRLMREASDGSDFDIFFVPSLSDMMRAPGP